MKLHIRCVNADEVVVADEYSGYAVASFYFQKDIGETAKFDAIQLANLFIKAVNNSNLQDYRKCLINI